MVPLCPCYLRPTLDRRFQDQSFTSEVGKPATDESRREAGERGRETFTVLEDLGVFLSSLPFPSHHGPFRNANTFLRRGRLILVS